MIKIESSQKPQDTVTFVHNFRVPAAEVKHMMPKQFATVYEYGLVNWHIQICESGGVPLFIRNIIADENREAVYQISLNPAGQREKHPPVLKIEFRMRIVDAHDKDIFPFQTFTHPAGFPVRNGLNMGYSTPERGIFNDQINRVVQKGLFDHLEFEVQTQIVFNVDEFLDVKYLNRSIGKPMPLDLNFRYNLLTNQKTHNFSLKTLNGSSFPCNKEALYVASPYFRKNFTNEMSSFDLGVNNLDTIEIVITWLLSESYHPPLEMTPELAEEVVKLADRVLPRGPNQKQLFGSVERHCFEELITHHEDLNYVKRLTLVAHNNRLGGLLEACHSVIISFHYPDFRRDMDAHPNPAFTHQTQMTRSSALTRLNENYAKSLYVKRFARKVPS